MFVTKVEMMNMSVVIPVLVLTTVPSVTKALHKASRGINLHTLFYRFVIFRVMKLSETFVTAPKKYMRLSCFFLFEKVKIRI